MNKVLNAFLIGGLIIGSTRYISTIIGPEYAALVGGFPTGLITPFFLPKKQQKANFFWGYLIDSIAMAFILVELYFMLNYGNLSGEVISSIALVSWSVIAVALVFINQKYNK